MKIEEIKNIVLDKGAEQLFGHKLIDFLTSLATESKPDVAILKHWQRYFDREGVPYVVQETDRHFLLWKKDENN